MLFLLYLGLEDVTEVDTDPKERFISFKVTTSNESSMFVSLQSIAPEREDPKERFISFKVTTSNESSMFVSLQSIAPESSWLGGAFLKDCKNICKIKMREMKTK